MKVKRVTKAKRKRLSNAQPLSLDIISILPQNIIETILCLLPLQEAVRTCILSKELRYNWTKIPKLVFEGDAMSGGLTDMNQLSVSEQANDQANARKKMDRRCKRFYVIYQVLLLHQGPIVELTIKMTADKTCVEIDQIITHLSRNNTDSIKKLTLDLYFSSPLLYSSPLCHYIVPFTVFSLHQLKNLHLCYCDLDYQPTFGGFGSLRSLYLAYVTIPTKTLVHLVSKSPLLKRITLLTNQDHIIVDPNSNLIELFECSLLIENLTISMFLIQCFVLDSVPQELPTSLIHLKYFCFKDVCFIDHYWLPFLALLIKISPNVEKIKLEISQEDYDGEITSIISEYSDIWLGHLTVFEIENFTNLEPELDLVNLILAKSPVLRKVSIMLFYNVSHDEEVKLLRILLLCPRASPMVEIIVNRS